MKNIFLRAILLITVLFLTIFQPYQILIYSQTVPSKQITSIETEQSPLEVVEQYCQRWIAGDASGMYQFLAKPTLIAEEQFAKEMARSTAEGARPLKIIKIEEPQFPDPLHATVIYSLQVPPAAWGKPDGVVNNKAYLTIGADKQWGISGNTEISVPAMTMSPGESKAAVTGLMEKYCNAWLKGDIKVMYECSAKPTIISEEQFAKEMARSTAEGARPLKIIKIEEPQFPDPLHATVIYSLQVPPAAWGKPDGVVNNKAYLTIGADKQWGISGTGEVSSSND